MGLDGLLSGYILGGAIRSVDNSLFHRQTTAFAGNLIRRASGAGITDFLRSGTYTLISLRPWP